MDPRTCSLLIVGAGISGMVMAMEARRRGVEDVAILESADEIGGTWRDNVYPGVACDVPSHLYQIASHPNPDWSRAYAGGAEIQAYLRDVAKAEGLRDLIRFGRRMTAAQWLGDRWRVETERGETWEAPALVLALGALHIPRLTDLPGLDGFRGEAFHSARWRRDVDLTGRRVAVIGAGASAVQFVPRIAKIAAQVTVFQRTPPWVLPRLDGPIPPWLRRLYAAVPLLRRLRRWTNFRLYELQHRVFRGQPRAVHMAEALGRRHMARAIADPALRARLTPDYRIGCKRILTSNDWYPALARDNVEVIAEPVAAFSAAGPVSASGREVAADVAIFGTGFHVSDAFAGLDIRGEDGLRLADAWAGGMEADLGTAVAGFPNLFLLLGPNTGLGHNSVVLMIEAQAEHVARVLAAAREAGVVAVAADPDTQATYAREMADRLDGMVWQTGGCTSWYRDETGRNTALWPGAVAEYQRRMRAAGLARYRIIGDAP